MKKPSKMPQSGALGLLAVSIVSLAVGAICGWRCSEADDLVFLDVGQGDCSVLRHKGVTILVDDGPLKRNGMPDSAPVLAGLRRRGIEGVDLILLSHPDSDHIGGTQALLGRFPTARVAISDQYATQPKLLRDLNQWHIDPATVIWMPNSAWIRIPGCTLRIVCPPVSNREDDNRGSMFIGLDDEGATAVFSGDAPAEVEDAIASEGAWKADILHAGHHGSRNSTGIRWLSAVQPSFAVISCGRDNPYGHPHRATLDRLTAAGIATCRTDLEGDLVFVPTGGHFVRSN